jgi:DNA-binding MarR family transcriptional regulator/N-acetylglutamate synthase-like GNAT family acetyltransferase
MSEAGFEDRVAAVRHFNRLYTQQIGVLDAGFLESALTLAEARVLYELAQRKAPIARELGDELGLDPGYLSRILGGFERQGLIERRPSAADRRRNDLALTAAGEAAFAALDARSREATAALLAPLTEPEQARLVAAMRTIAALLAPAPEAEPGFRLRPHRPGDIGWVASRHGALYAEEYGFEIGFEALVAEIAAKFLREFDPARERSWIAERHGAPVGSVFVVRQSESVAQLRLLLVDPAARGRGIGHRLVAECIAFARATGYRKMTLWTQSILVAARNIYAAAGFRLVKQEAHHSFGVDLVGENWELEL